MTASDADTIAAIATATGEGGIAVVRVSGNTAIEIGAKVFQPVNGQNSAEFRGYSVHYGRIVYPVLVSDGETETIDDGLLTVFRAPHSYTGEDTIELSCHGGRNLSQQVLRACLEAGARPAEPGEFTQRAFFNNKLDLAQAEAVADLIRAQTDASRRLARRQLEGGLSSHIAEFRHDLIGILASIEVTIDFSDEVGELDYDALFTQIHSVYGRIETLLATAERGRILREGLRVAIIGKPNVGKSSLLNALLRTERAIVTPIAGTTRDTVEETANINGVSIIIVDTAGIRTTQDVIEQRGVDKSRAEVHIADVILFVVDAVSGMTEEDYIAAQSLHDTASSRLVVAVNKADLVDPERIAALIESVPAFFGEYAGSLPANALAVSAQTSAGLAELEAALTFSAAVPDMQEAAETVTVTLSRHRIALEAAKDSLGIAIATVSQKLPGDFVAIDVRGALDSLGLITGETVTDEIVHRIFSDFCVGK